MDLKDLDQPKNSNLNSQLDFIRQENYLLRNSLEKHQEALLEREQKLKEIKESPTWQAGEIVIGATHSIKQLTRFPYKILKFCLEYRKNKKSSLPIPEKYLSKNLIKNSKKIQKIYKKEGIVKAIQVLDKLSPSEIEKLALYYVLMESLKPYDKPQIKTIAKQIEDKVMPHSLSLAFASSLYKEGYIKLPLKLLNEDPRRNDPSYWDDFIPNMLAGLDTLSKAPPEPAPRNKAPKKKVKSSDDKAKIAYILDSAFPYSKTAYSKRSESIIKGLESKGWEVLAITKPGYPYDRQDLNITDKDLSEEDLEHNGIVYSVIPNPRSDFMRRDHYIEQAALAIEQKLADYNPDIVMAASDYNNAYPALLAARNLGIPFIYEVSSLWEYYTVTERAGWRETDRFALDRALENKVMREADGIIASSKSLKNFIKEQGVAAEKIQVAYNSTNTRIFNTQDKNQELIKKYKLENFDIVLSFAGSYSAYEGLEDLIQAIKKLKLKGTRVALLLIGSCADAHDLQGAIRQQNIQDQVIKITDATQKNLVEHLRLSDAAVVPRKAFKFCKLETPLKPIQSMAVGLPVIASDLDALTEIVQTEETGLIYSTGDSDSLAEQINRLAKDKELRTKLAKNARQFALENFDHKKVAEKVSSHLKELMSQQLESSAI